MSAAKTPADTLRAKLERRGLDVRTDYSGRGMFGARCLAVDVPWSDVDRVRALYPGAVTDSMGRDAVVYWPAVRVEEVAS